MIEVCVVHPDLINKCTICFCEAADLYCIYCKSGFCLECVQDNNYQGEGIDWCSFTLCETYRVKHIQMYGFDNQNRSVWPYKEQIKQ